ncbi:MAG: sn-glycerol-3-phosphate ABC transporter permease UgpA [Pseudomonadota bacterium]|nr:sn-glycerol-3-phosphate ABC transporter permease UgpA [Pseudomonadota bacterium]
MRSSKVIFTNRWLPYMLLAPQLLVTAIFFLWPSYQAFEQSFFLEDAFGFSREFVGLENYRELFDDEGYLRSFRTSLIFGLGVTFISMATALAFAVAANHLIRGAETYRALLIWPYAVAPALAGVIWYFLMNPSVGIIAYWLQALGYDWNHYVNGDQALLMVIIAASWKQVSYNFLFFIAGLQSIPCSLIEAAAMDGAGPIRRFLTITFPLLSPTTFFLIVINLVYAFFDTFAIIHATTEGGPADATSVLVFRVYNTGFIGQDYGSSAAQSVVLMALVILMTAVQFRFVERRVVY